MISCQTACHWSNAIVRKALWFVVVADGLFDVVKRSYSLSLVGLLWLQ
jgi:hypothetical protein